MCDAPLTLVYAPNDYARQFMRVLKAQGKQAAAVVNSARQQKILEGYGINRFVRLDTKAAECPLQSGLIGDVYLFDDSFPLTCRYIRLIKPHVTGRIVVVLQSAGIPALYRHLGADKLCHEAAHPYQLLLEDEESEEGHVC
ncbi:hypothetical protein RB620_09295 [Paenibacillus sp. LHD-117]|uniref:hypothetical protein n=1 Tax=Paenibacillus sp. LHD-117 TaxID=3071412 RepID=UPI0027E04424|nr:hypothetical protein [Paenibacillus sp. LHD-117]MDQ6419625.1 hypothetical protein [Paenibacillus sp. LHD-117]